MEFVVLTDSGSDVPLQLAQELGIYIVPDRIIRADGTEYLDREQISIDDVLEWQYRNEVIRTSQPPPAAFYEVMEKAAATGKPILAIILTSKLSGTYQSAKIAMEMVDAPIVLWDSRSVSIGTGIFAILAAKMAKAGYSLEQTLKTLKDTQKSLKILALFDSLTYLRRGGRIGRAQEVFGTLVGAKPILEVTIEGTLEPKKKVVGGRQRALSYMARELATYAERFKDDVLLVAAHTDTPKDLEALVNSVKKTISPKIEVLSRLGPAITAHGGPGLTAMGVGIAPKEIEGFTLDLSKMTY